MIDFKVLGEIAGVAGIAYGFLYLSLRVVVKNIVPDLDQKLKGRIAMIILAMVWSLTILSLGIYVYTNNQNDGKEGLDEIKSLDSRTTKDTNGASLLKKQQVRNNLILLTSYPIQNSCPKIFEVDTLKLTFNKSRPYIKRYKLKNREVRIILQDINYKGQAKFKIRVYETEDIKNEFDSFLSIGERLDFLVGECPYTLTFTDKYSYTTGIKFWWRDRKNAVYELEEKVNSK